MFEFMKKDVIVLFVGAMRIDGLLEEKELISKKSSKQRNYFTRLFVGRFYGYCSFEKLRYSSANTISGIRTRFLSC